MKFHAKWCACAFVIVAWYLGAAPTLRAQQAEHAVSTRELRQDLQKTAEARQANEAAVRQLLSTDAAQKVLKSLSAEYKKVDQAVSQLSDEDLSRMAERSREVQKDFAAGNLTDRDLLIIMLFVVGLVLIIVAVR